MKDKQEIEKIFTNLPPSAESTKYSNMTYEQGIEETLLWVLGELTDEDFEYSTKGYEGNNEETK